MDVNVELAPKATCLHGGAPCRVPRPPRCCEIPETTAQTRARMALQPLDVQSSDGSKRPSTPRRRTVRRRPFVAVCSTCFCFALSWPLWTWTCSSSALSWPQLTRTECVGCRSPSFTFPPLQFSFPHSCMASPIPLTPCAPPFLLASDDTPLPVPIHTSFGFSGCAAGIFRLCCA